MRWKTIALLFKMCRKKHCASLASFRAAHFLAAVVAAQAFFFFAVCAAFLSEGSTAALGGDFLG